MKLIDLIKNAPGVDICQCDPPGSGEEYCTTLCYLRDVEVDLDVEKIDNVIYSLCAHRDTLLAQAIVEAFKRKELLR